MIIIAKRGNFVVRPGRLVVRRGDTVIWLALGANAHIFIPKKELFERRILDVADGTEQRLRGFPDCISDRDLEKLLQTAWSTALLFPTTFPMGFIPIPFSVTRPMRLLRVDPIRNSLLDFSQYPMKR